MPCFPVIRSELKDAESQLGIELPRAYKSRLLDPRTAEVLRHPSSGYFTPSATMKAFVDLTFRMRELEAEFPRDGVVMSLGGDGAELPSHGFLRFWLPDKRNPSRLGNTVYSWDLERRCFARDCSTDAWIDIHIEAVHMCDPSFFEQIGLPKPKIAEPNVVVHARSIPPAIERLLAREVATELIRPPTGWLECGEMQVRGKYLCPCDIGQCPDPGGRNAVRVEPGIYVASVKFEVSSLGEWPIVAAVRLLRKGAAFGRRTTAFSLDVDAAGVAIFDRQPFFRQVDVEQREVVPFELMDLEPAPCIVVAGHNAEILVTPSGDGDGTYPVYALGDGDICKGLEIEFRRQN